MKQDDWLYTWPVLLRNYFQYINMQIAARSGRISVALLWNFIFAICLSSWKVSLKWRLNSLHYAEVWGREDLFGVFFRHHFQHNSKLWGTKCTVHLSLFMCSNILPLLLSSCTASGKINYHLIHTVNFHLPTNLTQFHLSAEALPGKFSCLSNHDWMFSSIDFKSRFFLSNCNVLEQSCTTFAEW